MRLRLRPRLTGTLTLSACSVQDPTRCLQVGITVQAPNSELTIRPQGYPPYRVTIGSSLDFGIELANLPAAGVICNLAPSTIGTLTPLTLPGYPAAYRFTAVYPGTTSDVSGIITCYHTSWPAGITRTFPLSVGYLYSSPPTVSISLPANGSTTTYNPVGFTMSQNNSPYFILYAEAVIAPSAGFSRLNSCVTRGDFTSGYNSFASVNLALRNDADSAESTLLYYTGNNVSLFVSNSQCSVSSFASSTWSFNYATTYGGIVNQIGLRYSSAYLGTHSVWAQVWNTNYLSSGWVPSATPLTVVP